MKIFLVDDHAIRLSGPQGPMIIEAESWGTTYSPYHMLGSSLATCTWGVLASWAQQAGLSTDDLSIEVRWSFVEDPHRVGSITLTFFWKSLPEARRQAAQRAARLCPVHHTLSAPPEITIEAGS